MKVLLSWAGGITSVLISAIVVPGVASAAAISTVEFAQGNANITSIAILPPQGEMTTKKVGVDDSMIAESRLLEEYGLNSTVRLLQQKGYEIKTISQEDLAQDSDLQDLVRQANDRYDEEFSKLAFKPAKLKKGRYSVGAEAQQLADYLGVDAVAFERLYLEAAAAGQMVMALWAGNRSAGGAGLNLTVVNGRDGVVLGNYSSALSMIGKESAKNKSKAIVIRLAEKALRKFPAGPDAASVASDDGNDTMEELESLLDEDGEDAAVEQSDQAALEEMELLLDEGGDGGVEPGVDAELEELEQLLETEAEEGTNF